MKRVLVVDDDESIRKMVERVLLRESFHVDTARDGFEAIEKLSQNDYATVLLDLMMPRVDGLGVIRFLEEQRLPAFEQKVIVMTANMQIAAAAATAKPTFAVLPKPFELTQLVRNVRTCAAPAE